MKHKSLIDVAVLFIFFVRPLQTAKVFEQIKKARPARLYLYQDGPRENRPDDLKSVQECRQIVEDIDWECDVHRYYQQKNVGCDPSEFIAQKWMFVSEEKGIILEDDDVPSQSFFPYCKELLDTYADDLRINIICGMNNLGTTASPYSYFFTRRGSIWGWATWKRIVDKWDGQMNFMDDPYTMMQLRNQFPRREFRDMLIRFTNHRNSGKACYESISEAHQYLNHQLNIVPSLNMITNIGLGSETTHAVDSINKLCRSIRRVFYMKRYEISLPLRHPPYVLEDREYLKAYDWLMRPGIVRSSFRRAESLLYRLFPFLGK